MSWDFSTDPEFDEQLSWARDFVTRKIWALEPIAGELTPAELKTLMRPLQDEVKAHQLWATHLSPDLGGQGFGQLKLGLLNEIIGSSPMLAPLAFGNQPPDSGNSEILGVAGTEEQKRRWLYPLLAGEISSAFSMTEPETAGSDPTLLATRAVADGADWVIDGHKWYTSLGSTADFLIVMAVTDPNAAPHRRASMFIVPAGTPGLEVVRDVPTMEFADPVFGHGEHAELKFHSMRVPADALLGEVGDGFKIAQQRLGPGRIHHCMRWLGLSARAFDMLCERATYREAHGGVLAEKQTIQNWIADSAAEMQAARLMTLHAAWKMDLVGTRAARTDISLIKFFGAKVLHDVVDRALQAHGALGYSGDMPLEAMYRYARSVRLYDGPDEVHRSSVARRILESYTPPTDRVPLEHVPTRRAAAQATLSTLRGGR